MRVAGKGKTKRDTLREDEEKREREKGTRTWGRETKRERERERERDSEKGTPACLGQSKAKPTNSRQFEAGGMPAFLVRVSPRYRVIHADIYRPSTTEN